MLSEQVAISGIIQVLREIRNELHESNKLARENNARIEDMLAQFDESHEEFKGHHKNITRELRDLNKSVEDG